MAIRRAVRWMPDAFLSPQQTTIAGLDTSQNPAAGTVVQTAQLCAYDDTLVTGANYVPGDPAVERYIVVLYQEPVQLDLASFGPLTAPQAATVWANALAAFATKMQANAADALIQKAVLTARRANPIVLP